jgi:hypothetical protein
MRTAERVRDKALSQLRDFDVAAHSMPVFLAMDNHENEEGWHLDDFGTSRELSSPVLRTNERKSMPSTGAMPGSWSSIPSGTA